MSYYFPIIKIFMLREFKSVTTKVIVFKQLTDTSSPSKMSGKAYTMKEMKDIVEYLIEHRAYGDVKGRKMWMDYANSNLTTRTWQSLKETFLKRILPDICNPYYQLTVQQIASFREGSDIEARLRNKLEIQTADEDSSSNDAQNKNLQSTNENIEANAVETGEDSSKIKEHRSSTDTVVIEPCYNTAEEIQKELESPNKGNQDNFLPNRPPSKSIRDYITYSEPLTPILQEVLHDFETDEENGSDKEPQMQIVEYPEPTNGNDDCPIDTMETENNDSDLDNNKITTRSSQQEPKRQQDHTILQEAEAEIIDLAEDTPGSEINTDSQINLPNDNPDTNQNGDSEIIVEKNIEISKDLHVPESGSKSLSITDTLLPNNQEAFKELCEVRKSSINRQNFKQPLLSNEDKQRKRSQSHDIQYDSSSKRLCSNKIPQKASSDIDAPDLKHNMSKIKDISSKTGKMYLLKKSKPACQDQTTKTITNTEQEDTSLDKSGDLRFAETFNLAEDDKSTKQSMIIDNYPSNSAGVAPKAPSLSKGRDQTTFSKETTKSTSKDRSELQKRKQLDSYYKKEITNDIEMLHNSDSTTDHVMVTPQKTKPVHHAEHKIHRNKALANVFGFPSGRNASHMQHQKYRRMPSHQPMHTSGSEEWTSEVESEFVSPPRGRKYRNTRKYLKPKSARILSLEEEGGLFVMYGKKIYPVVKDGKLVKNYVTFAPGRESGDDESFWKLKYVEEKKKTDELTRMLKDNRVQEIPSAEAEVLFTNAATENPPTHANVPKENLPTKQEIVQKQPIVEGVKEIREEAKTVSEAKTLSEGKTVKIKYTKNDEEVHLEGHWSQVHPVLEHLVQILHKDPKPLEDKQAPAGPPKGIPVQTQTARRDSTPSIVMVMDEEVVEKVNKIEEEIFKEIEERENADSSVDQDQTTSNVTQRKARGTRKTSAVTEEGPENKSKASTDSNKTAEKTPDKKSTLQETSNNERRVVTRSTPKQMPNDKEKNVYETRRVTRKSMQDQTQNKPKVIPPAKAASQSPKKTTKATRKQKATKRYTANSDARVFSSPENISFNSIESSQGYQDSDASHISLCIKRKRKLSLTTLNRGRAKTKRLPKKESHYATDGSSDSNLSFVTAPLKLSSHPSSSLNTEIYRTDSYQLLFPQIKNTFTHLDKIDEDVPTLNKTYCINHVISDVHTENGASSNSIDIKSQLLSNGENSSHVTLPLSPVFSIVEPISVRRDVVNNISDSPIDVPMDAVNHTMLNEYMCSDVDMSVPLMEQNCGLQKSSHNESKYHYNIDMADTSQKISGTFVNKVDAVKIEHSLSESIQQKLKNLLLESAKKLANRMSKGENKDVESKMELCEPVIQRKPKGKKRCSTPRKRQNIRNSKPADQDMNNTEPLIVQEHKESCGSKKSAPPLVVVTNACEDNVATTNTNETVTSNAGKTKIKMKKDIIKVKIQRPSIKKKTSVSHDTLQKPGKSLQTDSGINDTESGVFLQGCDDSVDLIHNHSDTCLHAHECMGDSVEIIEENAISVISLNTNSVPTKELKISKSLCNINENVLLDMICEDARDAVNLFTDTRNSNSSNNNVSSINSLLTDDLSDDPMPQPNPKRVSKWYLFSEDETSNTKEIPLQEPSSTTGYGSNLQDIFPITCAVPDLSTITEEHTPRIKAFDNKQYDLDSQSLSSVKM